MNAAQWWQKAAADDAEDFSAKADEYGSADLDLIGQALMLTMDKFPDEARTPQLARELGIAYYLLGKVSRMVGAYADGRVPSDDTWHDASVYSMMGRFNRAGGYDV